MFYIDVIADKHSKITKPDPMQETALFIVYGSITINDETFGANEFILLSPEDEKIILNEDSRFVLLGGDKFEKAPMIHWNFVSFSKERIEQAKDDWKNQRFPAIPGDDKEFFAL